MAGASDPPITRTLGLGLENDGLGAVTLRSVRAVGRNASLAVVITDRPVAGAVIERERFLGGRVEIPRTVCRDAATRSTTVIIDAVEVRLVTLGMTRTQRLDVRPPTWLHCH